MQNRVWEPKNAFMEEYLKQWQSKLAVKNEIAQWQRPQTDWGNITAPPPDTTQPLRLPSVTQPKAEPQEIQPVEVPFWQRALQVFAAPFEWVDENVIRPGLAVGATSVGAIKDLPRMAGEDYFEWKKRSWDEWNAPGVDFKALWGEGDWRIDLKGVMEFAPWFLIPGAGQVGTATRAARGIAGVLGKAGMAGRALGLAVELSPWGLVEKTAGAAFRGVAKATGRVTGKVGERFVGKMPEPTPPPESVSKFTKFVKDTVIPKRKEFEIELKAMRSRQEIGGEEFLERAARGEMGNWEAVQLAAAARSGGVKSQFAVPLAEAVTRADVDDMLGMIVKGSETNLVKIDSAVALQEFFINGTLPMPHNLRDWAKVFGKEFADVVSNLKGVKPSVFEKTLDILNIPRAVLASADLSGFGRQGLILGLLHPTSVPRWFGRQLKASISTVIFSE